MIVGVTPATMDPPLIQKVKKEPCTPPPSPNRGQGMKEVSEDGSSSQKTVEKAQEDDVTGESPSAEKPEEAELADKEGEGSSSSATVLNSRKHKYRNRSCSWQQRPKTQIQTLKNHRKNRSCSWQQRPKTQIQTLKK